jgi:hypothetical protein
VRNVRPGGGGWGEIKSVKSARALNEH